MSLATFNHQRPVRDPQGAVLVYKDAPTFRVTAKPLGGGFGIDRKHRLVVGLEAGDVISLRPERTKRRVTISAVDLYRHVLFIEAAKANLMKARKRKEMKAAQRAARRQKYNEKKLTLPLS